MPEKLKNYFYCKKRSDHTIEKLVPFSKSPEPDEPKFSLAGIDPDGNFVVSSSIKEIDSSIVTTFSGLLYNIGDVSENIAKDYEEFLKVLSNDTPIIIDWNLTGNLRHGYKISGTIAATPCTFEILEQLDSGYLKVKCANTEKIIFVDYLAMSTDLRRNFIYNHKFGNTDLIDDDLSLFCGERCRPIFFPESNK